MGAGGNALEYKGKKCNLWEKINNIVDIKGGVV